jgi:hypothetical protein
MNGFLMKSEYPLKNAAVRNLSSGFRFASGLSSAKISAISDLLCVLHGKRSLSQFLVRISGLSMPVPPRIVISRDQIAIEIPTSLCQYMSSGCTIASWHRLTRSIVNAGTTVSCNLIYISSSLFQSSVASSHSI